MLLSCCLLLALGVYTALALIHIVNSEEETEEKADIFSWILLWATAVVAVYVSWIDCHFDAASRADPSIAPVSIAPSGTAFSQGSGYADPIRRSGGVD